MKHKIRYLVLLVGVACIAISGFLLWQSQQQEQVAETASLSVTEAVSSLIAQQMGEVSFVELQEDATGDLLTTEDGLVPSPSLPVEEEPATVEIDGVTYIGLLSIPQLDLTLPVAQVYSEAAMNYTPCVYTGTIEGQDLIIGAHNYKVHFGSINQLNIGDEISLQDALGTVHKFTLLSQEIIDGDSSSALIEGDWDLTLFTCVYGDNTKRVVLRFQIKNS